MSRRLVLPRSVEEGTRLKWTVSLPDTAELGDGNRRMRDDHARLRGWETADVLDCARLCSIDTLPSKS